MSIKRNPKEEPEFTHDATIHWSDLDSPTYPGDFKVEGLEGLVYINPATCEAANHELDRYRADGSDLEVHLCRKVDPDDGNVYWIPFRMKIE